MLKVHFKIFCPYYRKTFVFPFYPREDVEGLLSHFQRLKVLGRRRVEFMRSVFNVDFDIDLLLLLLAVSVNSHAHNLPGVTLWKTFEFIHLLQLFGIEAHRKAFHI